MDKYYDQKMKHLIALRSALVTILIVVIGGLFTMHMLHLYPLIYGSALVMGFYLIFVFAYNLAEINKEILTTLEEIKNA